MNELKSLLDELVVTYKSRMDNDKKYKIVTKLWTDYYKLSNKLSIDLDEAYQLHLMCESMCYKIDEEPVILNIDDDFVKEIINKLKIDGAISKDEAFVLLNYVVSYTRNYFSNLGINVKHHSLNGFCELGQYLTIKPFEMLGLKVTKNTCKDSFGYKFHHTFGTISIPIKDEDKINNSVFLVDTTYRQFFTSVNCNEGRYYTLHESIDEIANPDPGYFVEDNDFSRSLLRDGYVELTDDSAYLYGIGFYLTKFSKDDVLSAKNDCDIDFYSNIMNSKCDYSLLMRDDVLVCDLSRIGHKYRYF